VVRRADNAQGRGGRRAVLLGGPRTEEVALRQLAVERAQCRELLEGLDASAIAHSPSEWARSMIALQMASLSRSRPRSATNVEAILIASSGNCFSETSDDEPVPKSSMTRRTPISWSWRRGLVAGVTIMQERVFGDLQPHRSGREAGLADDAASPAQASWAGELAAERLRFSFRSNPSRRARSRHLATRLFDRPGADRHDHAGLFGARQELTGQHSVLRVVPAHERLEAATRPVAQLTSGR
jgi:hypothetical protein